MITFSLLLLAAPLELEREYERLAELRRAGRFADAAKAYEDFANANLETDLAQRALATAGAIHQWDLGQLDRAKALYDRVLFGPDARRGVLPALVQRLQIERTQLGIKAELELAEKLERERPRAEFAPWLLLHRAKVFAEELSDPWSAIALCERVRAEHRETTYLDDALFQEAKYLRKVKHPQDALKLYGAIIRSKKTSLIVGSYDSTHLDDAYFEVAETLRLEVRDLILAEKAYLELVEAVPLSTYVDDALYQARLLAAARGDLGRATELVEKLRQLRPSSRYL